MNQNPNNNIQNFSLIENQKMKDLIPIDMQAPPEKSLSEQESKNNSISYPITNKPSLGTNLPGILDLL